MSDSQPEKIVTAAFLVIGNEILSGRTKDKNIGYLAELLTILGIDLLEVRIVPDIEARIIEAVNDLRARHTYVFTCGGIGPTHDDITAASIAKAFDVPIVQDPRAVAILRDYYPGDALTPARLRMARIPTGANLIENPVSKAPGFRVDNVYVMAGVPAIMRAMLDAIAPTLKGGKPIISQPIDANLPESRLAESLAAIQTANPECLIGSYPRASDGKFTTQIVVRGRDAAVVARVASEIATLVQEMEV